MKMSELTHLVAVLALCAMVFGTNPAVNAACACGPGDTSTYCTADWAVIGQVVSSRPSNGETQVTIYVYRVLKGFVGTNMQYIYTPSDHNNCKPNIPPGKYLLAGQFNAGGSRMWLISCDHIETFQGSWSEINSYQPPTC